LAEQLGRHEDQARALAGGMTASESDRSATLQRLDAIAMRLAALSAEIAASSRPIEKPTRFFGNVGRRALLHSATG
jgi:hypothetical protein